MTSNICSDESSSSDDEYYNNFSKYKAKAALALRKVEKGSTNGQNIKQLKKNGTKAEKVSVDVQDLTCHALSAGQFPLREENAPEVFFVPNENNSIAPIVDRSKLRSKFPTADGFLATECSSSLPAVPSFSSHLCRIRILSKGQQKIFFCDLNEPLRNVIEEFAERTNVESKRVNLYTKQYKRCDQNDTPLTLGLSEERNEIELDAFEDLEESEEKRIALKYQMKGQRPTIVRVLPDATFSSLKELFCTDHGLDPSKTRFLLSSIEMIADEETPNSLGLEDGDCIDVIHYE